MPAILPYRIIFCAIHFLGAIFSLEIVWGFGDTALGLMAIPNLIAILALSGVTRRLALLYFSRRHTRHKTSLFEIDRADGTIASFSIANLEDITAHKPHRHKI